MPIYNWRGSSKQHGGNLADPTNWVQSGGPPGPHDDAVFKGSTGVEQGNITLEALAAFHNDSTFTGDLTILGPAEGVGLLLRDSHTTFKGTVTASSIEIVSVANATHVGSDVTFDGTLTATDILILSRPGSSGDLLVFSGHEMTRNVTVGGPSYEPAGTLEVRAGMWDNSGSVRIEGRFGALIIAGGVARIGYGRGETGSLTIGSIDGQSDTADVKALATLDVAGTVEVGSPGWARLAYS